MKSTPILHFALMCNRSNGGYISALTLIDALKGHVDLRPWSLFGDLYPGHTDDFEARGLTLKTAKPAIEIGAGDHVFFYMNEYPSVFSNYSKYWQAALAGAGTVQLAFNRTVGRLPLEHWLADHLDKLYFQDTTMQEQWRILVDPSPLNTVSSQVLAPPIDLRPFQNCQKASNKQLVIGRLAGDGAVSGSSITLYQKLADHLPDAEFWFMPSPEALQLHFSAHSQFRFFKANEINVSEFLGETDIFLLSYQAGVPVPGPRSLVEAMAAGCAPVVINRDGPKNRVVHGDSGYCADDDREFFDYVMKLATDTALRSKISQQARARAQTFTPLTWVNEITNVINRNLMNHLKPAE